MTDELFYRGEGASASRQADPAGELRRNRRRLVSSGGSEGTEAACPPALPNSWHARPGRQLRAAPELQVGGWQGVGTDNSPSAPPEPVLSAQPPLVISVTWGLCLKQCPQAVMSCPIPELVSLVCPVPCLKWCPQLPHPTAEAATGGHRQTRILTATPVSPKPNQRPGDHCFSHATPKSSVTSMSGL